MTEDEIRIETDNINFMNQEAMCRLWRFAPMGHPYFDKTKPLYEIFARRFKFLGGLTPEMSRRIGWDKP